MAERGSLGHEGSDGSVSGDRMTRAGYVWQASGENVAAGQPDAEARRRGVAREPGPLRDADEARGSRRRVSRSRWRPGKNPAVYWTQVFAAPR